MVLFPAFLNAGNDTVPSMNLPGQYFFSGIYNNASSAFYRPDAFKHGKLEAAYSYADQKKLHFLREGETANEYRLSAEGLTVQKDRIFWGEVRYRNFRKQNVQWSNVYDASALGPYIIADSIGGNVRGEEYTLSGGLAVRHRKWSFGGMVGYTAGQSYRKTDPRPKATAANLTAQLSIGYDLFPDYQIGISVEAGKYHEKTETTVLADKNKYAFFVLKGFGLDAPKLSDYNSSFSWRYTGQQYGAALFLLPQNGTGLLGNIRFNYRFIDSEFSSESDNRTPFTYKTYCIESELGWQQKSLSKRTFIKLTGDYTSGKGIERTYYYEKINEVFGQYILLSSDKLYTSKKAEIGLSGGLERFYTNKTLWVLAHAGYNLLEEQYVTPAYEMKFTRLTSLAEIGGEFNLNKTSSIVPKLSVSYSPLLSSSTDQTPQGNRIFDLSVRPDIELLEADWTGVNATFIYQHRLKNNMQWYASANGHCLFSGSNNRLFMNIAIGINY